MISVMFHSAGLNSFDWAFSPISDPLDIAREKLEVIHQEGYCTLSMEEAARKVGNKRDNLIHLTFDDGYLDNWVHIFPLLEKLNLKATIFVSAEFIDPREIVRDHKEIFQRKHQPEGCCAGFLSFGEMREMESSGLVEIQSHALTHTWYINGPEIVGFWHPGSITEYTGPVWMIWNRFPERKPFYLTEAVELEKKIPYGTPIYQHGKSLETVRYYPDEQKLNQVLIELAESKDYNFYNNNGWIDEFMTVVDDFREKHGVVGRYETGEEYMERVSHELSESKRILEEGLGHEINGICWPGGGVNERVVNRAREMGYRYFTVPSKWKGNNRYTRMEGMIERIGNLPRVRIKGKDLGYPTAEDFIYYLRSRNGYGLSRSWYDLRRIMKLLR